MLSQAPPSRERRGRVHSRVGAQVHEEAMGRQMQLQRDLNKLLERKSTWSDEDVERL